jgi:hypothetical protein
MRHATLLYLIHCAPPAKLRPVSVTVLGSVTTRHWETPEQGYPSDETGAGRAPPIVCVLSHRTGTLGVVSDTCIISRACPDRLDVAHTLDTLDLERNVSLSETTYDESPWRHGTSRATVIPFGIAPTSTGSFAIGEITQRQGVLAVSQQ